MYNENLFPKNMAVVPLTYLYRILDLKLIYSSPAANQLGRKSKLSYQN